MNQKKRLLAFLKQYGFGIWKQASLIELDLKQNMHWKTDKKVSLLRRIRIN